VVVLLCCFVLEVGDWEVQVGGDEDGFVRGRGTCVWLVFCFAATVVLLMCGSVAICLLLAGGWN